MQNKHRNELQVFSASAPLPGCLIASATQHQTNRRRSSMERGRKTLFLVAAFQHLFCHDRIYLGSECSGSWMLGCKKATWTSPLHSSPSSTPKMFNTICLSDGVEQLNQDQNDGYNLKALPLRKCFKNRYRIPLLNVAIQRTVARPPSPHLGVARDEEQVSER